MRGRLLALAGPAFTVLFLVVVFLLSKEGPGEDATGAEVLAHVADNRGNIAAIAFGGALLAALVVLFFSHLAALARERATDAGAGPTVMVAGAVLWAAGLLLGSSMELAVLSAEDSGLEQVAQTVNVLIETNWIPFIGGLAVALIGAGMTVLRTRILPAWLGWVALVTGIVALAGPGGFLGFFVAPLWMLVAGALLLREEEPAGLEPAAA